jgi:hypothetical protein
MAHEWREHPRLKGRFLPDYPDDVQVIIRDGGPALTRTEPEIVWVTITSMAGDLFRSRVRNQPHGLQTVRQNDEIQFLMPAGAAQAALLELVATKLRLKGAALTGWPPSSSRINTCASVRHGSSIPVASVACRNCLMRRRT